MSRASPQTRFVLNQTQPVRQSAEQVKLQPSHANSMVMGQQQQSILDVNNGQATLQINNFNIESNEMLGEQESEVFALANQKQGTLLPSQIDEI